MPHRDPDARREYMRTYKQRNRERLTADRRANYAETHVPRSESAWSVGHSDARYCRSCGGKADAKPLQHCDSQQHARRWEVKRVRGNAYRRERRAAARAAGTVHKGSGNPETKRTYARARRLARRREVFERLGQDLCVRCGFTDERALHIDHINGGGGAHRKRAKGIAYYDSMLALPVDQLRAEYQVLCANCNAIKRFQDGAVDDAPESAAQP